MLKNYRLQAGEILLMSEHSAFSFDSRYFGVQKIESIFGLAYKFIVQKDYPIKAGTLPVIGQIETKE